MNALLLLNDDELIAKLKHEIMIFQLLKQKSQFHKRKAMKSKSFNNLAVNTKGLQIDSSIMISPCTTNTFVESYSALNIRKKHQKTYTTITVNPFKKSICKYIFRPSRSLWIYKRMIHYLTPKTYKLWWLYNKK